MIARYLDIQALVFYGLLVITGLTGLGLAVACVMSSSFMLHLLGGTFMPGLSVLIVLAGGGVALAVGVAGLMTKSFTTNLITLEAEAKARIAAAEARLAAVEAERPALAAERVAAERLFRRAIIETRRVDAWKKQSEGVKAKWQAETRAMKARGGGVLTDEQQDERIENFFAGLTAIDPPLFCNMLRNPFALTESPKPLKQPDNPWDAVLEHGVMAGMITREDLNEVICPISLQVMQDPVKGEDGRSYDRFCLENIYYAEPGTYPFDRREMGVHPEDLPRNQDCYDKVQALIEQCRPRPTFSEQWEEKTLAQSLRHF